MQSDYVFNSLSHISNDKTDNSQFNLQNTRYSNLVLTNYFSDKVSSSQVDFTCQYPGLSYTGYIGPGIGGALVEDENNIFWGSERERPLERLQLFSRPFATVPYLGRGSCDPTLESQLLQGEYVRSKKSVYTPDVEKSFYEPDNYPGPAVVNSVEEVALGGWSRGGVDTRTTGDKYHESN
jgi:hypothetical protein